MANIDPSKTYTIDDFINMRDADDMTYYRFSILDKIDNVQHLDRNVVEEYLEDLERNALYVTLTNEEFVRYKYNPDLLAYDLYGTVQLDFIILLINGMIDPKEFDRKNIRLPKASVLKEFLSQVYAANSGYINQNRSDLGLQSY